jgi:hypothetical protein
VSSNWCYSGWARSVSGGSGVGVKGWGGEGERTGLESLERGEISFQGGGGIARSVYWYVLVAG